MVAQNTMKPMDPMVRLTDVLCTSLRRRQIVGSRAVALATATLVQNIVRSAKFTTIDELLGLIKAVGKRLVEANPKELASGNIIRRILRLIREEYRAAAAAHRSQPPSLPSTPYLGPETPGLHAPSNHYLSHTSDLGFSLPSTSSSSSSPLFGQPPGMMNRQTSLSNFVAMRHSRAQLERSTTSALDLSASTSSLFMTPTREGSVDSLDIGRSQSAGGTPRRASGGAPGGGGAMMAMTADTAREREREEEFNRQSAKLKPVLIQAIEEVVGELETTHEDVARGAKEHIHSSEVILTLGYSKTVETFLKQAYKDRKFTVIVAESAPSYLGHKMARSLSASSIPTLLIPDSSLHALIPRITKLLLGAHTVLANGGIFAVSGTLAAVLAAKAHAKPVVVTTGQFKFAPAWNLYHDYGAVDFQSPVGVVGGDGRGGGGGVEGAEEVVPYWEYVRPELVNLFVTNEGDHSPSYIYRLIKEAYDDEDVEL